MTFAEKWTSRQAAPRGEIYFYSEGGTGRGVHISFRFQPLICDSKPDEEKPWKSWVFRTNFNSVWLLSKYNSKAANMRINYIHKRKNNLLWGFISWRGFLSKRKKEKKRKFHLINLHGAERFPISLYVHLYKWNIFSVFADDTDYVVRIFSFHSNFVFFLLRDIFPGWLLHSFIYYFSFSLRLTRVSLLLHLLDSYQHAERAELAASP